MRDLILLATVQGLTEFLPISSSAHSLLVQHLIRMPETGRMMEIALHAGTLVTLLLYFGRPVLSMVRGVLRAFCGKPWGASTWMALYICVATLPVVVAGYFLSAYADAFGRGLKTIGFLSMIFGALMYLVDRWAPLRKRLTHMSLTDSSIVGILQILALIPGVSRLGMTLIAGRLLGYVRRDAATFSFFLAIPAILGAVTLMIWKLPEPTALLTADLAIALSVAALVGLVVLALFFWWLKRGTLAPFALYRIAFGAFLIWYAS